MSEAVADGPPALTAKEAAVLRAAREDRLALPVGSGSRHQKWWSPETGVVDALTRRLLGQGLLEPGRVSGTGSLRTRYAVLTDAGSERLGSLEADPAR